MRSYALIVTICVSLVIACGRSGLLSDDDGGIADAKVSAVDARIADVGGSVVDASIADAGSRVAIAAGGAHACAILDTNHVKCWGTNSRGELGAGDTSDRGDAANELGDNLPKVSLGTGRSARTISASVGHTCAILDDNSVKCWGVNYRGQLGLGDKDGRGVMAGQMGDNLPRVSLGTGRTAKALSAGDEHTCALLDDDSVKCWGANSLGQLGQGGGHRGGQPNEMGDNLPKVDLGTNRTA